MTEFRTVRQIGFLNDLLPEYKIRCVDDLRRAIKGRTSIGSEQEFQIIDGRRLKLDPEKRVYDKRFEHRRVIFDCEEIALYNSEYINLQDCVFLGSLTIGRKFDGVADIYIDSCIVNDELTATLNGGGAANVNLVRVSSQHLRLRNFETHEVSLSSCRFGNSMFESIHAEGLHIAGSSLGKLEVFDCNFEKVYLPRGDVDVHAQRGGYLSKLTSAFGRRFNPFDFVETERARSAWFDRTSSRESARRRIETFDFLLAHSEVRRSKRDASHVKYLRALAESESWASKLFVFTTGAFLKPARMILLSIVILLAFAIVYARPECLFSRGSGPATALDFLDALYFSGVTFTTLGYGDLTPLGCVRILAVVEALLGIVLSSGLAVSVARRYIE
jgi:hypothetical protein